MRRDRSQPLLVAWLAVKRSQTFPETTRTGARLRRYGEVEAYARSLAAQDRRRAQDPVRYAGLAQSHSLNITNAQSR
jgi:hypothetical protein